MSHVFISYARKKDNTKAFVDILTNHIENAGIEAWYDKKIDAGQNWDDEIDKNIENCFALILVLTPESRESEYVTYEWSYALGMGIPIIPIMKDVTDLHPKLKRIQYMDFTATYKEPWGDLTDRLIAIRDSAPLYIPNHPNANDIKDILGKKKLQYKLYDHYSEVKKGIVVVVISNKEEEENFMKDLENLSQNQDLTIIVYSCSEDGLTNYQTIRKAVADVRTDYEKVIDSITDILKNINK